VSWITFPGGTSGNGNATLAYAIAANGSLNTRSGNVTISWTGGSAQIRVQQGNPPDWVCTLVVGGAQAFNNIPSGGGQFTLNVSIVSSPPGHPNCNTQINVSSTVPWITIPGPSTSGPPGGTFSFNVANSSGPRNGSIVATGGGKTQTVAVTQQ
jgi:hypothetical protein